MLSTVLLRRDFFAHAKLRQDPYPSIDSPELALQCVQLHVPPFHRFSSSLIYPLEQPAAVWFREMESFHESGDLLLNYVGANDSLKQSIKVVVRTMIKQEMDDLRKTVDEKLSFNGHYFRQMLCGLGKISNIEVPRFREEPIANFDLKSLKIFNNEKDKFFTLVAEMHRLGISTRKISKLCKNIFGAEVSKNR